MYVAMRVIFNQKFNVINSANPIIPITPITPW